MQLCRLSRHLPKQVRREAGGYVATYIAQLYVVDRGLARRPGSRQNVLLAARRISTVSAASRLRGYAPQMRRVGRRLGRFALVGYRYTFCAAILQPSHRAGSAKHDAATVCRPSSGRITRRTAPKGSDATS